MLGSVVRTLTARPLLTRAAIEAMIAAAVAATRTIRSPCPIWPSSRRSSGSTCSR